MLVKIPIYGQKDFVHEIFLINKVQKYDFFLNP